MPRRTQVVLLCEDAEQRRFFEALCKRLGFVSRIVSVVVAPPGTGAAEAWVRARFPREVRAYRAQANHLTNGLLTAVDGDSLGVTSRKVQLDEASRNAGQDPRRDDERIAVCVPTWSIETWLASLCGLGPVGEGRSCKKDAVFQRAKEAGTVTTKMAVDSWFAGASPGEPASLTDGRLEIERLRTGP